jgi:hypothetical protein
MNLTEIYINIFLENFFQELQEEISLNEEVDPNLQELLDIADEIVFKKFGINPQDKVYFIAGSAALYLYPELRTQFDLRGTIGDLDIVIPDPKYWENAGLESQTIYRPEKDKRIEVFTKWDPAKAGGEYANVDVRSTSTILSNAVQTNGYWFMPLRDILDYKIKLDREKEKNIVSLVRSYQSGSKAEKIKLLKDLLKYYKRDDIAEEFLD